MNLIAEKDDANESVQKRFKEADMYRSLDQFVGVASGILRALLARSGHETAELSLSDVFK